jgi:phosphoserine phosphatase
MQAISHRDGNPTSDSVLVICDFDKTLTVADTTWLALKFSKSYRFTATTILKKLFFCKHSKTFISADIDWQSIDIKISKDVYELILFLKKLDFKIILISGSSQKIVDIIAEPLRLFDSCYGSTTDRRLKFKNKLDFIHNDLKIKDFIYIADAYRDISIWRYSYLAIVVNRNPVIRLLILLSLKSKKVFFTPDKTFLTN